MGTTGPAVGECMTSYYPFCDCGIFYRRRCHSIIIIIIKYTYIAQDREEAANALIPTADRQSVCIPVAAGK